jgi:hypothetical protein
MKPSNSRSLRWRFTLLLGVLVLSSAFWLVNSSSPALSQGLPQEITPIPPAPNELASPVHVSSPAPSSAQPASGEFPSTQTTLSSQAQSTRRASEAESLSQHIRTLAFEYRQGRNNIFFKEKDFLRNFVREGEGRIEALKSELLNTSDLADLPSDVNYLQQAPDVALERMGMVDMLEGIAREDRLAIDALAEVVLAPIRNDLPPQAQRAVLADKFDALTSLTRVDRHRAFNVFSQLESASLRKTLRTALIAGLIDTGVSPPEAHKMTESLM